MTLLILAGGLGSRYGSEKQFDTLGPNGEFLFEFGIYDAIQNNFKQIVIVTKENNKAFLTNYLRERLPKDVELNVVIQEMKDLPIENLDFGERKKPWGTAHAVWSARNVINNSFVVMNADDYYGKDAFLKSSTLMSNELNDFFGIISYPLKNTLSDFGTVSRGICKSKDNILLSIEEMTKIKNQNGQISDEVTQTKLTGNEPTSMNFWICSPSIFKQTESYLIEFLTELTNIEKGEVYIPLVVQNMIDNHGISIKLEPSNSEWFGVTYAEDRENAVKVLKQMTEENKYPSPLWKI